MAVCSVGVGSFLLYSTPEGIRGIALDLSDNSDALMPLTGTLSVAGLDYHAGEQGDHTVRYT